VPDAVALRVDHDHGAALKPSGAEDSEFTIVSPSIGILNRWAGEDVSASRQSRPRCSRVRRRLAGSKRITGQKALDEGRQRHGPAAGIPAVGAWDPTPALDL